MPYHVVVADNYAAVAADHLIDKDEGTFDTAEEAVAVARDWICWSLLGLAAAPYGDPANLLGRWRCFGHTAFVIGDDVPVPFDPASCAEEIAKAMALA